ncbi:uncharacterized protein LOC142163822 [Nicotiana tabacum]|uniref:Uncharacterized protein LOC142163822 n=1 Tax=Nicotiana tabacum TaxID=4097 RepID=A0AC58RWF3_TOBAC
MEEVVLVHEAEFEANPTGMYRERLQKVQAELIKCLALEEKYWQQKVGMTWFKERDRNTKLFHAQVRGRRKRHQLNRIENSGGTWIVEEQEIAEEAIKFYEEQFTEAATPSSFNIIEHVPNLINTDQNAELIKQPTKEEVKVTVLGLTGDSAGGQMSGFVKGKNIVENILLTQEIVTDIRLRTKVGPNVILKLDMTKAYDRLSWLFLTKVLRKMGFTERLIGIIFGLVSNNWYSILINGQAHGFFKSSRGVKQDDMIIFSSSDETSLMLIMQVLNACEVASGQLVNKTKSTVYLHHLTDMEVVSKVERITSIHRNDFPIIYLGCPIFYARRRLEYYQPLITKVMDKLQSWQVEEGGIGFRSLHDVAKALFSKLWWNFRTKPSLWSSFVCQKYCLGALYFLVPQDFGIDETVHNVYDVTLDGEWDVDKLFEMLPEDLAVHILEKIKPPSPQQVLDMPCWMLETRGYFSVKSAWDYMRRRDEPRTAYRMIWPDEESLQHLFFRSETAKTTWKYFLSRAGIAVEGLTLHQAITKCWTVNACLRLKPVMQALPSCVVWELWKRRNSMKYGDAVTTSRVIYQVSSNLQALVKVRKPGMDMVPHKWQDLLAMMENFTPKLKVTKVMWEFPSAGWLKVNTDGASRGNPGRSSIGFCIRNENGDIVKSVGKAIEETTNTVAEAKAMVEALRFCRFQQYSHVWLQTDSMLLKTIMDGIWKPPWIISEQRFGGVIRDSTGKWFLGYTGTRPTGNHHYMELTGLQEGLRLALQHKLAPLEVNVDSTELDRQWVMHTYREQNQVADTLAKYGTTLAYNASTIVFVQPPPFAMNKFLARPTGHASQTPSTYNS